MQGDKDKRLEELRGRVDKAVDALESMRDAEEPPKASDIQDVIDVLKDVAVLAFVVLVVGCTSYRDGARAGLRATPDNSYSNENAGEEDDAAVHQGDVVGRGDDAGEGRVDVGEGDAGDDAPVDLADAGLTELPDEDAGNAPEPEPERAWYEGYYQSVRIFQAQLPVDQINCLKIERWRVELVDDGLEVEREGGSTFVLDRVAWGFEGATPDGYFSVSFDEGDWFLRGSLVPEYSGPLGKCGNMKFAGARSSDLEGP